MPDIRVVTPSELSSDFVWDSVNKKWTIVAQGGVDISNDEGNALTAGTDGGVFLNQSGLKRYRLVADNVNREIKLYELLPGETLDPITSTVVGTAAMSSLDASVDDVAIDNGILTFSDVQSGNSFVLDTNNFITAILKANSNSIAITGNGKNDELVMDLIVDPANGNLLKVTATGASVSEADILAIIQANQGTTTFTAVHDVDDGLKFNVNGVEQTIPTSRLLNTSDDVLGYLIAEPE